MSQKLTLCLLAIAFCVQVVSSEVLEEKEQIWRQELRQAQDSAANRLQINLITALNGLAQNVATRGQNVTKAVAVLTRAVVTNTFDLAGVVAYMPRLLLLDMPTQLVEVLRLLRNQQVRVPNDVNSAIDTVTALTRQSQASGIADSLFAPILRFLPNLLAGVQVFLQTIIGNVFGLLGVNNLVGVNNNYVYV